MPFLGINFQGLSKKNKKITLSCHLLNFCCYYCFNMTELVSKLDQLIQKIENGESITRVDLSNSNLVEFPEVLYRIKDEVEFINFGGNSLSSLPERIIEFKKLRILFFANNKFISYPSVLKDLPNLYMISFKSNLLSFIGENSLSESIHWLILTDNKLKGNLSENALLK